MTDVDVLSAPAPVTIESPLGDEEARARLEHALALALARGDGA